MVDQLNRKRSDIPVDVGDMATSRVPDAFHWSTWSGTASATCAPRPSRSSASATRGRGRNNDRACELHAPTCLSVNYLGNTPTALGSNRRGCYCGRTQPKQGDPAPVVAPVMAVIGKPETPGHRLLRSAVASIPRILRGHLLRGTRVHGIGELRVHPAHYSTAGSAQALLGRELDPQGPGGVALHLGRAVSRMLRSRHSARPGTNQQIDGRTQWSSQRSTEDVTGPRAHQEREVRDIPLEERARYLRGHDLQPRSDPPNAVRRSTVTRTRTTV